MLKTKFSRRVVAAFAGAVIAAAVALPAAAEPQPGELARASHDKGGHRVKALSLVRSAIGQVEAGIRFDNRH